MMLETTVGRLLRKAVRQFPERVAVVQAGRSVTYSALGNQVNRFANALLHLGIQKGDRVAIWMHNSIEYIVADFAVAVMGGVRVPLNHLLNPTEAAERFADAEVRAIVVGPEFFEPTLQIVRDWQGEPPRVIVAGRKPDAPGVLSFEELVEKASAADPQVDVDTHDLVAIMYTGGTTGRPKGVMHTHKTVIALMYSMIVEFDIERDGVMLHVAPLPHAAGFMVLPGLLRGNPQVLCRRFDPEEFVRTVEEHRVTFTFLVPTMIYALLDQIKGREDDRLRSLATLAYGASPMSPDRIKEALGRWGPILLQAYSQMEVANQTTVLTKADHITRTPEDERRLASCGRPIIMSEVRVVDDSGNDLPAGEVGELITRGPHMMPGYWRRPQETAEAIRNGWLYTGDMAYADEQGYLYLVDRKKDMIISGGMNVYSAAVEKVVAAHPAVAQVAVIGVPDDYWGEAVRAVVVLRPGMQATADEIISFCRERLSRYEVPKAIDFVSQLPLTPYGKIDKKALRAPFWQGRTRAVN